MAGLPVTVLDESVALAAYRHRVPQSLQNYGFPRPIEDDMVLVEAADHSSTPAAGLGAVWVKDDAPNVLMYTDDDGNDFYIITFERRDIAFTDETSDLTTGDAKAGFHMPNYATTLLEVSVGTSIAPTGSAAIFDFEENGTTVLSTLITIDAGTKTSEDAGTPPVISDSAIAANAFMTVNTDQIGSGVAGAGAKLYVKYKRA